MSESVGRDLGPLNTACSNLMNPMLHNFVGTHPIGYLMQQEAKGVPWAHACIIPDSDGCLTSASSDDIHLCKIRPGVLTQYRRLDGLRTACYINLYSTDDGNLSEVFRQRILFHVGALGSNHNPEVWSTVTHKLDYSSTCCNKVIDRNLWFP